MPVGESVPGRASVCQPPPTVTARRRPPAPIQKGRQLPRNPAQTIHCKCTGITTRSRATSLRARSISVSVGGERSAEELSGASMTGTASGGRTDASTSTDDVKTRPLCLFYFTHPFGVLSPEPPTVTGAAAAAPHVARTFLDMQPLSSFYSATSPSDDYCSTSASRPCDSAARPGYAWDLVGDSPSSSLFSGDAWFGSGGGSQRVVVPYHRTLPPLPPLRLPTPQHLAWGGSDDAWSRKLVARERFSLPPIELPCTVSAARPERSPGECGCRAARSRAVPRSRRRARLSGVQRMVACLMKRTVKGGAGCRRASPALRDALRLLRDAWPEPRVLPSPRGAGDEEPAGVNHGRVAAAGRVTDMWKGELPGRAAASPGLLRRRYSMPETIMRKYRLAQQRSEEQTEEAGPASSASAASTPPRGACGCCRGARPARRDRELMRKSALLRLWGRAGGSPCRVCCCGQPCGTRSLDGSRSELRHASGWTTPRRPRLDSSRDRIGDDVRPDSDATYRSHARYVSSSVETTTDVLVASSSESEGRARNVFAQCSERAERSPKAATEPVRSPLGVSPDGSVQRAETDDRSLTDSSDTLSTSMPTAKESTGFVVPKPSNRLFESGHIDGRISERSACVENDQSNMLPYDRPLTVETPSYEILEIVVSETVNVDPPPAVENEPDRLNTHTIRSPILKNKKKRNIDIDEYVSNILVESLNSLTDQLESMNASMGADRKLSIVEKEIKVKLQNTGVNTIVHLSPTSNNQIIFGNEELYNCESRRDHCNNLRDSHNEDIREEIPSIETNNNLTSAESARYSNISTENVDKCTNEAFLNATQHENVNKAVLQQIQKLFQGELQNIDSDIDTLNGAPEISHIEISNVDVFIDNNGSFTTSDTIEVQTQRQSDNFEVLSGVGTGNYYDEVTDADAVVPRFSAFPHTDSMEVNTSSSEDAEVPGSECTSLVDSLDDPNSPRSVLLRKSFGNSKRSELVRSAIDVLDLLPENTQPLSSPKEKGESFFIRIKDDNCDCEKENIVVADHMPETIKQRLYRRHRKRELRMECARRSKVKLLKRELEKQRHKEISKCKKDIERECMAIINALVDDVINKIAQDEYKCMRIKQRTTRLAPAKSEENVSKRHWKRDAERSNDKELRLTKSDASQSCSEDIGRQRRKSERHIRGKLSLQAHPPLSPEDAPRRIYQTSEIRDGTKCIEILEILEYVNSSQSSSDTLNSDENQNLYYKNKKSRIPVPVHEKSSQRSYKNNSSRRNQTSVTSESERRRELAGMLLHALGGEAEAPEPPRNRTRSNSLRFKRVFDIIPEERSSLSVDSPDDAGYSRRASAPSLDSFCDDRNERVLQISDPVKTPRMSKETRHREMRSAGTSPMPEGYGAPAQVTSPVRKSASTSPIKIARVVDTSRERGWQPTGRRPAPHRHEEGQQNDRRKAAPTTQHEAAAPRRPVRSVRVDADAAPCAADRSKRAHREMQKCEIVRGGRRSTEGTHAPSASDHRKGQRCGPHAVKSTERRDAASREASEEAPGATSDEREEAAHRGRGRGREESSSSSESGGSLLCSLAPAWLHARRRRRRAAHSSGEWAVTVAGSCPAALPNDVEMRLRFPERAPPAPRVPRESREPRGPRAARRSSAASSTRAVECGSECGRSRRRALPDDSGRLTLTVKREASDSSILASKSVKKSTEPLPELETYRASRTKTRSSVKTRRGCSLHCWLPQDEPPPIRNNGLSVLGCAIVPELKPRAPSMSERDLTRDHVRAPSRARRRSLLRV